MQFPVWRNYKVPIESRVGVIEGQQNITLTIPAMHNPHPIFYFLIGIVSFSFVVTGLSSIMIWFGSGVEPPNAYEAIFGILWLALSTWIFAHASKMFLWRAWGEERIIVSQRTLTIEYRTWVFRKDKSYELKDVQKLHKAMPAFLSPSSKLQLWQARIFNVNNYTFLAFLYRHELVYFGRELNEEDLGRIIDVLKPHIADQ